ncbi:unnamed protein product, partial [Ectocarpus sp. 12 AP-2014]
MKWESVSRLGILRTRHATNTSNTHCLLDPNRASGLPFWKKTATSQFEFARTCYTEPVGITHHYLDVRARVVFQNLAGYSYDDQQLDHDITRSRQQLQRNAEEASWSPGKLEPQKTTLTRSTNSHPP